MGRRIHRHNVELVSSRIFGNDLCRENLRTGSGHRRATRTVLRVSLCNPGRGFRLLGLVVVVGAGVHFQFAEHFTAKFVFWQHAANGFAKYKLGVPLHAGASRNRSLASVTGVPCVLLVIHLRAGEAHFVRIDDNDEVARVNMRRVGRLVFAHQDHGDVGGESSHHLIIGVYQMPFLLHFLRLRHERFRAGQRSTPGNQDG